MKKQVLTLAIALIFNVKLLAQCVPVIPSNAIVVNAIDTVNGGFDPLWVCPGDSLHTDGGFHNIYLEAGSLMTTGGGIDSIFVKKGASLYMNGGIDEIFFEDSADVHINGGIPTLTACQSLSFSYINAPPNGCFTGPVAVFQAADTVVCSGSCINFSDQSINAVSWQWLFPGGTPAVSTSQNPQQICYPASGSYDVTLIAGDGQQFDTLVLTNYITVNQIPQVTGSQNGNVLSITSGFAGYQWYYGTIFLNGANNDTLTVSQQGSYSVLVTDSSSCDTTVSFVYFNTGYNILHSTDNNVLISPNPAKDLIIIRIQQTRDLQGASDAKVEITNTLGKTVCITKINLSKASEISLKNISPGIYFVKVMIGEKQFIHKLLIE